MSTTTLPAAHAAPPSKQLTAFELWGRILVVPYLIVFLVFVVYPVGYGLWLARQLPVPVLFSGGAGWAQQDAPAEAAVAARIAARDYGRNLRWQEAQSHDTRGNARFSLPLLQKDGITQLVLVTHGWHMRRAQRAFDEEAERIGMGVRVVPAPMGLVADRHLSALQRWVPSAEGNQRVRQALREWIGLASGACFALSAVGYRGAALELAPMLKLLGTALCTVMVPVLSTTLWSARSMTVTCESRSRLFQLPSWKLASVTACPVVGTIRMVGVALVSP